MTNLTLAAILQASILAAAPQEAKPREASETPAEKAYQRSMRSGQPLVLLFGAPWCPACNVMKDRVLPEVRRRGGMDGIEFAHVNVDQQPELAQRLLRGRSIPQLIRFDRTEEGWRPQYLIGAQSPEQVSMFLATDSAEAGVPANASASEPAGPSARYSSHTRSRTVRQAIPPLGEVGGHRSLQSGRPE